VDSHNHKWNPNDFIRLAALMGGFLLFCLGAWLLFSGISAEGVVDLKSAVLSGTLKSSSAGLYICFFAAFIILAVLLTLRTPREKSPGPKTYHQRLMLLFWGLLGALALSVIGTAVTDKTGFAVVNGVLTTSLTFVVLAIMRD
jgi:hypothetical protein